MVVIEDIADTMAHERRKLPSHTDDKSCKKSWKERGGRDMDDKDDIDGQCQVDRDGLKRSLLSASPMHNYI